MRDEYRAVTLEQLLSHTAGLPAELPGVTWVTFFPCDSEAGADRARMVRETLALEPASPAGSAFLYSNLGYVVAGSMAETVTGKTWEALMKEEVFTP
ncbi:MAG: beta-lactamase family protein, partial [Thermoleophilia bacterium]|nr:beta-lactamase family protein [Thermoleophilia bacterium]